jgi:hypothetical protein
VEVGGYTDAGKWTECYAVRSPRRSWREEEVLNYPREVENRVLEQLKPKLRMEGDIAKLRWKERHRKAEHIFPSLWR